jgi:hypothetical protein
MEVSIAVEAESSLAKPKSASLMAPPLPTSTFCGFRSRCMMLRACRYASAEASCLAMERTVSSGSDVSSWSICRSSPCANSVTTTTSRGVSK